MSASIRAYLSNKTTGPFELTPHKKYSPNNQCKRMQPMSWTHRRRYLRWGKIFLQYIIMNPKNLTKNILMNYVMKLQLAKSSFIQVQQINTRTDSKYFLISHFTKSFLYHNEYSALVHIYFSIWWRVFGSLHIYFFVWQGDSISNIFIFLHDNALK